MGLEFERLPAKQCILSWLRWYPTYFVAAALVNQVPDIAGIVVHQCCYAHHVCRFGAQSSSYILARDKEAVFS
jgi:hypothetical protein